MSQPLVDIDASELAGFSVHPEKISECAAEVLRILGCGETELSVKFTGPAAIQKLNREYRQKDTPTDVLSFPQHRFESPLSSDEAESNAQFFKPWSSHLGDLVICPEVACGSARSIGHGLDREVLFLMVHGILHLCGHDHIDPDDAELMFAEQAAIMNKILQNVPWSGCLVLNTNEEEGL